MTRRDPQVGATFVLQTTHRWQERPMAYCQGCDWERDDGPAGYFLTVRAAARRHVRASGHVVTVSVRDSYEYDMVPAGQVGAGA